MIRKAYIFKAIKKEQLTVVQFELFLKCHSTMQKDIFSQGEKGEYKCYWILIT